LLLVARTRADPYSKLARFQKLSFQFWLFGILSSLTSTTSSLVKLRADSRRFALSTEMARREAAGEGKTGEDRTRAEEERREKGRALLA
jgi:peroxin-11B